MKLFHLLEQELSTPSEHIKKELYAILSLKKQSRTKKKKSRAALDAEQLSLLDSRQDGFSGSQGLSSAEAVRRLKRDGLNILSSEKKVSAAKIFAGSVQGLSDPDSACRNGDFSVYGGIYRSTDHCGHYPDECDLGLCSGI